MRLGIDLGTTRVVVAAVDRGNYPVVTFEAAEDAGREWYPSLLAFSGTELRAGYDAEAVLAEPGWEPLRSLKRYLATMGPGDQLRGRPIAELTAGFLGALREALLSRSNLRTRRNEPLEVAIAVPANASANQRLLTADAFIGAGFRVLRILDEPSAAGLEYAWRRPADAQVRRRHLAVYDLGGGTFDASIIAMGVALHEVITTEGVSELGGDDFDAVLLTLACRAAGCPEPALGPERDRLLEACRQEKERVTPATRRLSLDLLGDGGGPRIDIEDYEAALRPLIDQSLDALETALTQGAKLAGPEIERHTVIYQVGGASQLPAVGRALRERFGRRVWRSPYPHASVAIGLAIAAEEAQSPRIAGRLTRHFGVWRDRDAGLGARFDVVFEKDTPLPATAGADRLVRVRRYRAHHNVGHFRFIECSRLDGDAPAGDVTPWAEVRAPLIADLRDRPLETMTVCRLPEPGDEMEERHRCDANGVFEVEIENLTAGYSHTYRPHARRRR
jgi:molecular chaperone DnaK (HSP70)